MTDVTGPDRQIDAATRERLGGEIQAVDTVRPWDQSQVDTSDVDPDIRESTPEELAGE